MASYQIIVTPAAETDLSELRNYIAHVLHAKGVALNHLRKIRGEISSLAEMPSRNKLVDDEPWHSLGVRRAIVNNFFVYYRVDEGKHTVFVLNVIYAKRDQLRALKQMEID